MNNPVVEKSFLFSLEIIKYSEALDDNRKFVIAKQILRSGTSIGANIHEAQSAESRPDFIHKMKIASKEAIENRYWLMLCRLSKNYPDPSILLSQLDELIKLLNAIISKAKQNNKTKN